jgi:hypothetical protein
MSTELQNNTKANLLTFQGNRIIDNLARLSTRITPWPVLLGGIADAKVVVSNMLLSRIAWLRMLNSICTDIIWILSVHFTFFSFKRSCRNAKLVELLKKFSHISSYL